MSATLIRISAAGNTLATSLALLREMGFDVARYGLGNEESFHASDGNVRISAEDLLQLLGLATIARSRGSAWPPTDKEVDDFLCLIKANG